MPKISARSLVLVVQAVDREIKRIRSLPDDRTVPGDLQLLDDYENLADDLEELYEDTLETHPTLPPYAQLVHRRE